MKDADVDQHLEMLGYNSETVSKIWCCTFLTILNYSYSDDSMCGTTRYKVAKAPSKTMPNLDETGIVTGGCRHVIAQKAVNMFRGEMYAYVMYIFCTLSPVHRYGYSHYLHEKVFAPNNIKWLWQNVICQYWGWAQSKHPLSQSQEQWT